jgi:hypothetical protein
MMTILIGRFCFLKKKEEDGKPQGCVNMALLFKGKKGIN